MRNQEKMRKLQEALREAGIQVAGNKIQHSDWTNKKCVLSSEQQRIWFLQQFDQSGFSYNIPVALRVKGALRKDLLEKSIDHLIQKHHVLRSTFGETNGEPYQQLHDCYNCKIEECWYDSDGEGNTAKLNELIKQFLQTPFDLKKLPLFRIMLVHQQGNERLLLSIHHIIADGWSTGIIAQEIADCYLRLTEYILDLEPELPIQYMDYAFWEQSHRELLKEDIGYWKERLMNSPQELQLPQKKQKYPGHLPVGVYESFCLSNKVTGLLKELAVSQETTLYVMLLTVFAIQLGRYSGQNDVIIGCPIAGRQKADTEKLIGLFVNTLPIRVQMQQDTSYLTFIDKIKEEVFKDFAHQTVPLERIVEELKLERDFNKTPLFQVMLTLQNTPMPPLNLPGAVLEIEDIDIGISQFDLSLTFREEEAGLKGFFEYDAALFDREDILAMCRHFIQLAEYFAELPDSNIKTAPMLTDKEKENLFIWNQTECSVHEEEVIHQIFYENARIFPKNIAVVYRNNYLTYQETEKRARQITNELSSRGISTEERVGIYMEYSLDLLPAVLGILGAGGAYVPIDTSYPDNRVAYIIQDSDINLVLTQTCMLSSIASLGVSCICCDDLDDTDVAAGTDSDEVMVDPEQLACIIYTSGSTGVPKGVMLHHRGIVNMMWSFVESYKADERDRMMPLTSIASSSFIGELLPLMSTGGGVVLVRREDMLDPDKLFEAMVDWQVSIVSSVPSLLTKLCERDRNIDSLRLILSGGEAFQPDDFSKLSFGVQVVNGYGLTETSVCSSYIIIPHEKISQYDGGAVGKPIRNTEIFILDQDGNQLPVGCPGEIYIAGAGVAKGYLNNPELTQEAFVPHLFRKDKVMYKTGDMGYWGRDGNLYYVGRLDNQIKIRGYRIEIGEIEKILRSSGKVREVAVIPQKIQDKYTALTACIVPEQEVRADALRRWAVEWLPAYMRPAHYLFLDELPRNPNGKVDRAALGKLEVIAPVIHERSWGRKTKTQEIICEIWKDVLNTEINSPDDNFFELGGHSLLLMQVHHQMKEKIEKEIAVIDLLKYPTIGLLSEFIDGQQEDEKKRAQMEEQINGRIHKARNAAVLRRNRMK